MIKQCSKCNNVKPLSSFTKKKKSKDGYNWSCTPCNLLYNKTWRETNKEKRKKERQLWRAKHPDINRRHNRERRAREAKVNEEYSPSDESFTRNLFHNQCANCGSIHDLCIDHHYPLSKGHALSRGNAVILCRSCNSSKWDKPPEEFYSKERLCIIERILAPHP